MSTVCSPSPAAFRAALTWWDTVPDDRVEVYLSAGLGPLSWWRSQARYLEATRAQSEAYGEPAPTSAVYAWEFEFVTVFGGMEVDCWSQRKRWGRLLEIRPVTLDDPLCGNRLLVSHKPASPWHRKWAQRSWMKSKLPRSLRSVVNRARSIPFRELEVILRGGWTRSARLMGEPAACELLLRSIHLPAETRIVSVAVESDGISVCWETFCPLADRYAGAEETIRRRLGMDLRQFWRTCGGKSDIPRERMAEPVQLTLF